MKLKFPNEPIPLVFGKAFHSALEKMERDKKNPLKIFEKEFTKKKLPAVSIEKFALEKEEGLRLLKYWRENKKQLMKEHHFTLKEYEVEFTLHIKADPLTKRRLNIPPIRGFVDFVTGEEAIGDYKTSKKKYSQEMVDTSDQPTFYYLWYLLEYGRLPSRFIYIVFRKGIKRIPIQILETQRTMKQVSDLLASIQEVVLKVENKEYYQRHDRHECYFCDCNTYEEMLKV